MAREGFARNFKARNIEALLYSATVWPDDRTNFSKPFVDTYEKM